MTDPFTVRPATIADYAQMCALLAEVDELHRIHLPWMFKKPPAEPRSTAFFEQLIESEDSALLVAEVGPTLVGVATALLRNSPDFALFVSQRWCVLDNIAIVRPWRRRGIGSALIRHAEQWAQARGANWIELGVYEFNETARSFYRSLGYAPVSTKLRKPLHAGG